MLGLAERSLRIISERYADFGPTLVFEKLAEVHDLYLAKETVRKLMTRIDLWLPRMKHFLPMGHYHETFVATCWLIFGGKFILQLSEKLRMRKHTGKTWGLAQMDIFDYIEIYSRAIRHNYLDGVISRPY